MNKENGMGGSVMSTDNQSAQSALLPCPFCGNAGTRDPRHTYSTEGGKCRICCGQCGAHGPWQWARADGEAKALEAWNTRALAQAPAPSGEAPEGWVLVPKKATWEMQQAALDASRKLGPLVGLGRGEYVMPKPAELWCSAFIYKAMIAAAPKRSLQMTEQSGDVPMPEFAFDPHYRRCDDGWWRSLAGDRVKVSSIRNATPPTPEQAGPSGEALYVASRASVPAIPAMWRRLRTYGWPIIASWIDEAGEGETADLSELWQRIGDEIQRSTGVILYARAADFPLKGALIECGIAIGMGKRVAAVLPGVELEPRSMRPVGSWLRHPLVSVHESLDAARAALASPGAMEGAQAAQPSNLAAFVRASDDEKQQVYRRVIEKANAEETKVIEAAQPKPVERTFFQRMEDGRYAEAQAEYALAEILGIELLGVAFDDYDSSFEIYPLEPGDVEVTADMHAKILALGCSRYWINFRDGTERYCMNPPKPSVMPCRWDMFNRGVAAKRAAAQPERDPQTMPLADLQRQVGRLQAILVRRVCGDPSNGIGLSAHPPTGEPT